MIPGGQLIAAIVIQRSVVAEEREEFIELSGD
jgi:hypothetical protein